MKVLLGVLLFLFPIAASATGFSSEALFLSKTPVTEGDAVLVHVVIANDSPLSFEGAIRVTSGTTTVGTVQAILKPGEARTVSVPWSPRAGVYALRAELVGKDGSSVASEEATFIVAQKPQDEGARAPAQTSVDSSQKIQGAIAGISKPLADSSRPAFETMDSLRQMGAEFLDEHIAQSKERLAQSKAPAEAAEKSWGQSAWTIFETFILYLLTLLRHVLASAALFYPLLAFAFLYLLWRLYRRMGAR